MEYLGAWGTLIHEKNLKSKISCQTPFKGRVFMDNEMKKNVQGKDFSFSKRILYL